MMIARILFFLGASQLTLTAGELQPVPCRTGESLDPTQQWSLDVTSGVLWQIGSNTPLDYTILPQIISLRTPAHVRLDCGDGQITVRARASFLLEPIIEGPESFYAGLSLSPSLEYWNARRNFSAYFSAGGGAGFIDSQGVEGGQGQDLTLNWFADAGLRYYFQNGVAVSAGCMFQHWSNGGMTDPNPGVDAFGPTVGVSWPF